MKLTKAQKEMLKESLLEGKMDEVREAEEYQELKNDRGDDSGRDEKWDTFKS